MPSQTIRKKNLYLGKCLGDLTILSEVKKVNSENVDIIIRTLNKIFKDAEANEKAGDEEQAYILYLKYFNILKIIKTKANYKKKKDYYDTIIGMKNQCTAIDHAEKLSESLKERYDLKEAEVVAKKLSDIDLHKKEEAIISKEKEDETSNPEEQPEITASTPGLINCLKLCDLLRDSKTKVILMDVRSEKDFKQSHISFTECINVPEEILIPGSTVGHIQRKLPSDSQVHWTQRKDVDYIVLLDWKSTLDNVTVGTPLKTLKDAIYKFDQSTIIKSEPLVLQGGYEQWLLFYPTMTTNAHVRLSDDFKALPPSPTLNLDFDYPDFDDNLQNNAASIKGIGSNSTPSPAEDVIKFTTPSVPRVDRSLKPSSSKDEIINKNDLAQGNYIDPNSVQSPHSVLNNDSKLPSIPNISYSIKNTNILKDFTSHGSKEIDLTIKNNLVSDLSASVEKRQEKEGDLKHFQETKDSILMKHENNLKEIEQKLLELEKIKKKEQKDVADLLRMKRKLKEELDAEKQKQIEEIKKLNEEEQRKSIALEMALTEEKEKKQRMEDVEKLRQERKKEEKLKELEKRLEQEEEAKHHAQETLRLKLEYEKKQEYEKLMEEERKKRELELRKEAEKKQEEEIKNIQQRQKEIEEIKLQEEAKRRKIEADKKAFEKEALERKMLEEALRKKEILEKAEREAADKLLEQEEKERLQKAHREKEALEQADKTRREKENAIKMQEEAEKLRKFQPNTIIGSDLLDSKTIPTNSLPIGWEKKFDHTNNKYYYLDHNKETTHWNPPASAKNFVQLKDEPAVLSSRGLSRSHSSPNINKLVEEEASMKTLPSINRGTKPSIQTIRQITPKTAYSVRKRDLHPVYGNVGSALTGLKNLGSTCYMNSTIQCLNNTSPLIKYFLDGSYFDDINRESAKGMRGEVVDEFAVVVKALWSGEYRSISPRDFKSTIAKYKVMFGGNQHQDSHEFLLFLLDGLHEGLNEVKKAPEIPEQNNENLSDENAALNAWKHHKLLHKSIIVELFQGQTKSTLLCKHCQKSSVTFETFQFLLLPIPASSKCTLMECLRQFLKPELLVGSSKWKCPRCKVEREAEKKMEFWKLPPILLVGLNRFYGDGMWMQKQTTYVDFPVNDLDLSELIIGPPPRSRYNLYGISNHYGTMDAGHYTAYCKNPVYKKWYKFDDQDVYEIGSSEIKSAAAYILYYTSIDMPIPVIKPHF